MGLFLVYLEGGEGEKGQINIPTSNSRMYKTNYLD